MPTLTKPVSPTLVPASGADADDNAVELFEADPFELDIRIIVPEKFRPMLGPSYSYTCYYTSAGTCNCPTGH